MALETVRLVAVLPATADRVYAAWMDSAEHAKMTGGGKAAIVPDVGGEHSAWDGYISGRTLELEPGRRIVQSWRTTDFPLGAVDSRLEVHLLDVDEGRCEVALIHSDIPEGQGAKYEEGWREHYLLPMQKYFGKPATAKPAAKKAGKKAAKKVAPKKAAPKKAAKKGVKKAAAKKGKKAAKKARKK